MSATSQAHREETMITTEQDALEAVRQDGMALEDVPEKLKTPEICAEAVCGSGWALAFVPEALKTPELCLEAVMWTGKALEFVPEALKSEEICRAAVRTDRKAILVTPLEMVDRLVKEWWPMDPMVAQWAWSAWRAAAIAGRITLDEARAHGVDQFLPRRDVDGAGDDV